MQLRKQACTQLRKRHQPNKLQEYMQLREQESNEYIYKNACNYSNMKEVIKEEEFNLVRRQWQWHRGTVG